MAGRATIVIATESGRLGNRLLTFSHLLAFAIEHELALVNTSFRQYAPYFETTSRDLLCRYPPRSSPLAQSELARAVLSRATRALRRVVQRAPTAFAPLGLAVIGPDADGYDLARPEALELTRRARVILTSGWLFSGHFFLAKHAQAVRSFFRPLPRIRENVNTIVARARARSDILVGIHIRHGDYRLYRNGRYFYPTAAYATLMHRARGLFGERVGFLVCSDELQDRSRFDGLEVSFGSGHLVEDMYALAGCDYILGPPSTFSWWASVYGDVQLCWVLDPDQDLRLDAFSAPFRLVRKPGGAPIADGPNAEPLSSGGPFAL